MTDMPHPFLTALEAQLRTELEELAASTDPVEADEPIRAPYETRLRVLQQAVWAVETGPEAG